LKFKVSAIFLIMLTLAAASMTLTSFASAAPAATAQTPPAQTIQTVSATGNGFINPQGKRDDFSFYARGGALKPDGWRYNPNAQVTFTGRDFKTNTVVQVWSTNVWRFKVESATNGKTAVIAGTATVKVGQQEVRGNWWIRITAKDGGDVAKDTFMIQLWRPIGANNAGGWSPGDFKVDKPASLHLNTEAAYQVQGVLKAGNIVIKP
jgi:hypothetical protein